MSSTNVLRASIPLDNLGYISVSMPPDDCGLGAQELLPKPRRLHNTTNLSHRLALAGVCTLSLTLEIPKPKAQVEKGMDWAKSPKIPSATILSDTLE